MSACERADVTTEWESRLMEEGLSAAARRRCAASGWRSATSATSRRSVEEHTCALDTSAKAWCWGDDANGQVGDGAGGAERYVPVRVAGDRAYSTVTAGRWHTCALDTAGKGRCWGSDEYGETGGGPYNQDPKYVSVPVAGGRTYLLP